MQLWTCSGSDRQKWTIATDGSNNIQLTSADHLCLNIDGGRTVDGTNVDVTTCDKSNPKSQQVQQKLCTSDPLRFDVRSYVCVTYLCYVPFIHAYTGMVKPLYGAGTCLKYV